MRAVAGESRSAAAWVADALLRLGSIPIFPRLWVRAALAAFAAGVLALRVWLETWGSRSCSHDAFFFLDGAWRMLSGQRPHVDFITPFGFLGYVPTILGLQITHSGGRALAYAQVFCAAMLGVWALLLTARRMFDVSRVLLFVSVILLVSAPFALGMPPAFLGPAMTYNRYGYAMLALVLAESLFAPRNAENAGEFLGGVSTGAIAALLLFSKFTYCGAAGLLVVALIPVRRQTVARWVGMASGFFAVAVACAAYLGFDLRPMWNDVRLSAGAKQIRYWWYFGDVIVQDAVELLGLAAATAAVLAIRGERAVAVRFAIAGEVTAAVGLLIIFSNFEQTGFPMLPLFAVMCLEAVGVSGLTPERAKPLGIAVTVFCLVLIAGAWFSSGMGYAYGTYEKLNADIIPHFGFDAPPLAGLELVGDDMGYVPFVNDGLALLRKNRRDGETVMSLDFTNPFSFGLNLKPPLGGSTFIQYMSLFDDTHKPSPEWLFGHADLVMFPKTFSDPTLWQSVPRIYGPYLKSHFQAVADSPSWILYRRIP